MTKFSLTAEQAAEVCNEIEDQWLHLVITRAVFSNANFPHDVKYDSPSFYSRLGIQFKVEILTPDTENFRRASYGLKSWHNKNFVIRLCGVLQKHDIMKHGRAESELLELIYTLRHDMGAHGFGGKPSSESGIERLKKATGTINKLFGGSYKENEVRDYSLPIDGVLEKMKNRAVEYVKTLTE